MLDIILLLALVIGLVNSAHLSHVIMPFHQRQVEIVKDNLKLWSRYPPCRHGSLQNIGLIFYVSGNRNEDLVKDLLNSFNSPCFNSITVEFAELSHEDDRYLKGSRLMFEKMLSKKLDFNGINPSHVFYMEPDALPIRPFWLETIKQQIISPNAMFWMKGSIFRGQKQSISTNVIHNHIHINGNAIYNLEDDYFRKFYFELVRPFIKMNFKNEAAYDTDIFKVLLWDNAKYTKEFFHMFQFSDFIQNHWHSEYSLSEIRENSPNTFLVHGGSARE